jgi:hypothetical protein
MNTNSSSLAEKASGQYLQLVGDKVKFLIETCWPSNIVNTFRSINELIDAAKALEAPAAKEAQIFSDEEISFLKLKLSPLLQLKMTDEVKAIVKSTVTGHKIGIEVADKPTPKN